MKKKIEHKFIKDLIECILIGIIVGEIGIIGILIYQRNKFEQTEKEQIFKSELDYRFSYIEKQIKNLNKSLIEKTDNNYNDLNQQIKNLPEKERINKIKLEQTLKQINIMIINKTVDAQGSGVSIKYKEKFYILTAGHMVDNITDELYLYENENEICKLEIIKQDYQDGMIDTKKNDLLLLKPIDLDIQPKFYTEIATTEPPTGSQIYIIGNPISIEDVISDGRIIAYQDNFMYFIDHTYFGSSGGGIYNQEGKIIGIISHLVPIQPFSNFPAYVINGAVRLDTIQEFLKDVE